MTKVLQAYFLWVIKSNLCAPINREANMLHKFVCVSVEPLIWDFVLMRILSHFRYGSESVLVKWSILTTVLNSKPFGGGQLITAANTSCWFEKIRIIWPSDHHSKQRTSTQPNFKGIFVILLAFNTLQPTIIFSWNDCHLHAMSVWSIERWARDHLFTTDTNGYCIFWPFN